jgi:hypothetical protein
VRPATRRHLAASLLVVSIIGWPVSALTWAQAEPQFILGLSWLAITLTAADIWATTDVRTEQEDDTP